MNTTKFLYWLLGIYVVLFSVLAFNPIDRHTWFVENLTVWIILAVILLLYKFKIKFSKTALFLMFILIYLHTIGGHYTFAQVPFDWVTNFFNFSRNHFDRLAHFTVGFYAFAVGEWLWTRRMVTNKFLLFTYPVFLIATIAMSYELVEWIYAAKSNAADAMAYLGSQGDIWDAQKDMLADTLGAIVAMGLFFSIRKLWTGVLYKE
jgi:putative membrane protein